MNPTHKARNDGRPVTAWQFSHASSIPVWVFRKFHQIPERDGWSAISTDDKIIEAEAGDWAVAWDRRLFCVLRLDHHAVFEKIQLAAGFPWERKDWKPADCIRNLVKAGALIAAEIDRLLKEGPWQDPNVPWQKPTHPLSPEAVRDGQIL